VKPFWAEREAFRKQKRPIIPCDQTTGFDHGNLAQRDIPPSLQAISDRHAVAPLGLTPDGRADIGVTGTQDRQSSYFPMTSPLNVAIYAFGGLMLLALAIGFFGAPA
jgi:hypothetical protein